MVRSAFAILVSALVLPGLAAAAPAVVKLQAASPVGSRLARVISISYDDRELATAEGAAALYQRIEAASRIVCGEQDVTRHDAETDKKLVTCRQRAIRYAISDLNAPRLEDVARAATR